MSFKHGEIQVCLLPPANVVCEGYVFTGVCHSFCSQGGHAWFYSGAACMVLFRGGMHGFIQGGHAWFYSGGMRGFIWGGVHGFIWGVGVRGFIRGDMHGFIWGGMHGFIWGACVVLFGGRAWFFQFFRIQWDTVNERAVCILLECILVKWKK